MSDDSAIVRTSTAGEISDDITRTDLYDNRKMDAMQSSRSAIRISTAIIITFDHIN
jgi:hypothetical protein